MIPSDHFVRYYNEVFKALDGKVEFNGTHWQAESDTTIAVGTTVEIVRRTNLILFVKPLSSNDKV